MCSSCVGRSWAGTTFETSVAIQPGNGTGNIVYVFAGRLHFIACKSFLKMCIVVRELVSPTMRRAVNQLLESLRAIASSNHLRLVLPGMPSLSADEETVGKIRHGRTLNLAEFSGAKWVKVFAGQSELVCLARRVAGSLFHPKVVLVE